MTMENTTKKNCGTEIYLQGSVCYQTAETFDEIMGRLETLSDGDFIYVTLDDGCRAAFRKRNVVAVSQYEEE